MKVLITGGYGFIGSHVAETFYKEGYEVHILDNLSTGRKENINFPHKSYILSIDDPKCKNIFSTYKFDVVVHLAAQVSVAESMLNPTNDAQLNIVGLINILELAKQYDVKKFIFASSAAVYGNNDNLPLQELASANPISPYGISKASSESYCHIANGVNGLETVVFRFSNVYGPRQTATGEGGFISIYTDRLLKNEPVTIHGDGTQTRDFIYVGDVAFAIFRASEDTLSGVYNLSTNSELSLLTILDTFERIHGPIEKEFTAPRDGDIYRSALDNTKLKNDLDWSPLYTIEEGLQQTYDWAASKSSTEAAETEKKKRKK